MTRRVSPAMLGLLSGSLLAASSAFAGPLVVEDFEDGASGFTVAASGFTLEHAPSGGNAGGHVRLTDLVRSGQGGFADAPASFLGDLSTYAAVEWDTLRPAGALAPSTLLLTGAGTEFTFEADSSVTGAWVTNRASLGDASGWNRSVGDATFAEALADTTRLGFLLEVNDGTGREAGLDNVRLIPNAGGTVVPLPAALPATLFALSPVFAGAALRKLRRRRR